MLHRGGDDFSGDLEYFLVVPVGIAGEVLGDIVVVSQEQGVDGAQRREHATSWVACNIIAL